MFGFLTCPTRTKVRVLKRLDLKSISTNGIGTLILGKGLDFLVCLTAWHDKERCGTEWLNIKWFAGMDAPQWFARSDIQFDWIFLPASWLVFKRRMVYYKNDCEMCPCILSAPGYCILMLLSTQSVLFDMSQPATHIRKKKLRRSAARTVRFPSHPWN